MKLILIRHGKTFGNTKNRYIGTTDEELCPEGIEELMEKKCRIAFWPDFLYVSPLKRCRQSAQILFPNAEQLVAEGLRECDFGEFENKNYMELSDNTAYQSWIDSNGTMPFPGGESMDSFRSRVLHTFFRILQELPLDTDKTAVFVVHGGTIMSILDYYNEDPAKSYFDFRVKNGDFVNIEHMIAKCQNS